MTSSQDPYCYPDTHVLKNLGNCLNSKDLDVFETHMIAFALPKFREKPILLPFGSDRLKETHRRLFDCVYPWAGQFREHTGRMTKQLIEGLFL